MESWNHPPPQRPARTRYKGVATTLIGVFVLVGWLRHRRRTAPPPEAVVEKRSDALRVSSGTIGAGGALARSLSQAGLSKPEISKIEIALKPLLNPRSSKASDIYEIFRSSSGRLVRLRYWPNKLDFYTVEHSSTGVLLSSAGQVPLTETVVGAGGKIDVSLWEAMTQQQVPAEMIYRFAELFSWQFDFLTEPRQGDVYKVIWRRHSGNGAVRDDAILGAYYQSRDKGDLYAFPLAGQYYDQEGASLRGEFLRAPLAYRRISSRFTNNRFHPILRYWRPHHGTDYSAARGTPVVSIGQGVVVKKDYAAGLGNEIRIRHAGRYVSIYGHLMGFARGLHIGSPVKQGQLVGYVGSTGLSTGPHLHFGFERDGKLINFLRLKIKGDRQQVPPSERPRFEAVKEESLSLLNQLGQPGTTLQTLSKIPQTAS